MEFLNELLSLGGQSKSFLDYLDWNSKASLTFQYSPELNGTLRYETKEQVENDGNDKSWQELLKLPNQNSQPKRKLLEREFNNVPAAMYPFKPLFIRYGVLSELDFFADNGEIYVEKSLHQQQVFAESVSASEVLHTYISQSPIFFTNDKDGFPDVKDLDSLFRPFVNDFFDFIKEFKLVNSIRFAKEQVRTEYKSNVNQTSAHFRPLKVLYKIDGNEYQFSELSDGAKRLIYLLSELYYFTRPDIEYPVQRPILLEEPELGVHPHLLFLLLQKLRNISYNHQIILTTHSPQVLNILEIEELDRIIIADYDKEKGTTLRHLTDKQMEEATIFMENEASLSAYWLHTNLLENRDKQKI